MKKQLLFGLALVTVVNAFPQSPPNKKQRYQPVENIALMTAKRFASLNRVETSEQSPVSGQVIPQQEQPATGLKTSNTSSVGAVNWNNFTGSMNMYGVLTTESKPLQFDDELNAVTFVHRKSATYVASPVPTSVGATTGVLCAMVSQNWGSTWDSTMIYNDNNNWARYPQGGILKAMNGASPSNTNIANSYIVATAPITSANTAVTWIGNIVTTKALGAANYNNVQSASSQTFISNTPPYTGFQGASMKVDFLNEGFTSTDDGKIRAIGSIEDAGTGSALRGARIVTGSFISGTLLFTSDSLIPPVRFNSVDSSRLLAYPNGMAWSEDGQTGYVYFIGAHTSNVGAGISGANIGCQPIIAKTINGGGLWTWEAIDFNQNSFKAPVLDHLQPTAANPNLTVPFFNFWEGISCVVDTARNLHLVSMVVHSPAANDPDSVLYTQKYINYDGENYYYAHAPGNRPYLYDFHGGYSGGYSVTLIDSLATEGPGDASTDDGYGPNPWAPDPASNNSKIKISSRIQASRTIGGRYVIYSWAETDTTNTTNGNGFTKWNLFPNVKARLFDTKTNCLSATEINVSKLPDANGQTKMAKTSYNHYISQKCAEDLVSSSSVNVVIKVPHTISFNSALNPATPATHRYASVPLEFSRPCIFDGIATNNLTSVTSSYVYPNPASNSAILAIDLKNNSNVKISLVNLVGQTLKTTETKGNVGANNISIDLSGLSKGIYLLNINAENATGTKKLIVE